MLTSAVLLHYSPDSFPKSYLSSRICSPAFPLPCSVLHHYMKLLHSLPRLCTAPLQCSTSRNQQYQKPIFPALSPLSPIVACTAPPPSPALQQLASLPISTHKFCFCTAAQQKALSTTTPLQSPVAQPSPEAPIPHPATLFLAHSFHSIPGCSIAEAFTIFQFPTFDVAKIPLIPVHSQPDSGLESHKIHPSLYCHCSSTILYSLYLCRRLQSLLKDNIEAHLASTDCLESHCGFTKGRSCLTNLSNFFKEVTMTRERVKK